MQVQEMKDFIGDKKRLVREDSFKDGIGNIKVGIVECQSCRGSGHV
jgi:hypothetical protein